MNKIMNFASGTPKVDLKPLPEYEISLSAPYIHLLTCHCTLYSTVFVIDREILNLHHVMSAEVSFTSHHLAQGPGSSVWTAGIVGGIIFKWATTSEI